MAPTLETWNNEFLLYEHFTLELEGPWLLKSRIFHSWKLPVSSHLFYTRAWGPKGPRDQGTKEMEWMTNLRGVLTWHAKDARTTSRRWVYHKSGWLQHLKNHNSWLIITYYCKKARMNRMVITFGWDSSCIGLLHYTWKPMTTQHSFSNFHGTAIRWVKDPKIAMLMTLKV